MQVNQHVIVAVGVLAGVGAVRAFANQRPLTPVIIGGYVLLLALSVADLAGGQVSQLVSALSMLAVLYVVLTQFPWFILTGLLAAKK